MPALVPVAAALAQTATPTPQPTMIVDEAVVTPGPIGFFAMLFVGIATLLLVLDLVRRVRRVRYRDEIRDRLRAEREGGPGNGGDADGSPAAPDVDALPPLDARPGDGGVAHRAGADTAVIADDEPDPGRPTSPRG